MDFLHCNSCAHYPNFGGQKKYFLTSCGHVFCEECSIKIQEVCPFCNSKCRVVQVTSESKSEIKAFFTDPTDLLKANMTQLVQVMQFQKAQVKNFSAIFGKLMERHNGMLNEINGLKNENESYKKENAQLLKRLEALQQQQQIRENREQCWIGNGVGVMLTSPVNNENRFMQQPIDPTFSSIFGNPVDDLPLGESALNSPYRDSRKQLVNPEPRNFAAIGRNFPNNSRFNLQATPMPAVMRRENINRFSPCNNISSNLGSGSGSGCTPQVGVGVNIGNGIKNRHQQQPAVSKPSGEDILSRLKKLRW